MEYFDGQDILFGGYNASGAPSGQTWVWNDATSTWSQDTATPQPQARAYASMAEDTGYANGTGALVLFGGCAATSGQTCTSFLNDTWTYTATGWTETILNGAAGSPSARDNAAMAYNGSLAEPTLFGGCTTSACTSPLADTWEYTTSNTWVLQSPTAVPAARAYAAMADNSTNGQLVLVGGNNGTTTLGDTQLFYSAPNPPTHVTAVAGNGQATVTFKGQPFYGVVATPSRRTRPTSSPDGQTCTVSPAGVDQSPVTYSCVVTGLTNGTSYTLHGHRDQPAGHLAAIGAVQRGDPGGSLYASRSLRLLAGGP